MTTMTKPTPDPATIAGTLDEQRAALRHLDDRLTAARAARDRAAEAAVQAAADRSPGIEATIADEDRAAERVRELSRTRDRQAAAIAELEARLDTATEAEDVAEQEDLARRWAAAQQRLAEAWATFAAANDELAALVEADAAISQRRGRRSGVQPHWCRRLHPAFADAPIAEPMINQVGRWVDGLALKDPPADEGTD